jgi:fused signal recognition particle receptor
VFDFLKKRISGFIDGLTKKEEDKEVEEIEEEKIEEKVEEERIEVKEKAAPKKKAEKPVPEKKEKPVEKIKEPEKAAPQKTEPKKPEKKEPPKQEKIPEQKPIQKMEADLQPCAIITIPQPKLEIKEAVIPVQIVPEPPIEKPKPIIKPPEPIIKTEIKPPEQRPAPKPPEQKSAPAKPEPKEEVKPRIRLSPINAIKSFITQEVEIGDNDVREMLDSLELELLESDVEMGVAEGIKAELSEKLIGSKVKKSELHSFISASIRQTLVDVLRNENSFDLITKLEASEKPLKIMFIGINGAGKTTTIAKVARLFMDNDKKVVFAAADTFRAAAIEQIEVHAGRLGVKTIKRDYGSDPTSVAFDAVGYAKAHGIDAVLIDTAGRQDTNISLLNEIKKMSRVISPDLKIYIGESISGNAILEQISSFNREVGIDAVILTKMDCDPKGGTMLSISKATGIPIIYVGTGQAYTDLERFEPEKIADRIVG